MTRWPLPTGSAPPPSALGADAPPASPTRPTPNAEPACIDLRYSPVTSNSRWPSPAATDAHVGPPGPAPASTHSSDDGPARRIDAVDGLGSPGAETSDSEDEDDAAGSDVSFALGPPWGADPVRCVCYGRGRETRLLPESARRRRRGPPSFPARRPSPGNPVAQPQPSPPPPPPPPPSSPPPPKSSVGDRSTSPLPPRGTHPDTRHPSSPPPFYPAGPPPHTTRAAGAALARLVVSLPEDDRTYRYLVRVRPSQSAVRREALRIVGRERGEGEAAAAVASVRRVALGGDDEVYEVGDLGDDLSGVFAGGIPRFFVDVRLR